ncbi:hypothetical protein PS732_03425 [Pseudomonas fluorescens]|uniref:Uncharacterized protein n=1 Tax=Pseudomonas fluorescens TaxID=294 RepID=A0ABD7VIL3_PSEFL|nr:RHS repeat-associated core domain-containing protein [Pseudomonas fluorescens]VVP12037.1 hypothetical protein PS732_03425 [Pseudomonas fluorescens]
MAIGQQRLPVGARFTTFRLNYMSSKSTNNDELHLKHQRPVAGDAETGLHYNRHRYYNPGTNLNNVYTKYHAYGNLAALDVSETENPLRFQGQYFDAETGLHSNRHRYYNPDT